MTPTPIQLTFVVNAPSPHMADLYRALAARSDVALQVIFLSRADPERAWPSDTEGFAHAFANDDLDAVRLLQERGGPRGLAVLTMYTHAGTRACAAWCRRRRMPFVYLAEPMDVRAGRARRFAREVLFARAARGCRAVWGISGNGVACYRRLMPHTPVERAAYWMDVAPFLALERPTPIADAPLRVLSVGQLIERKGFDRLMRAIAAARREVPSIALRIVGAGPEREPLGALAETLGMHAADIFAPAVPFAERTDAFRDADVFAFATRHDGWGMVVAEAMAAGLPVVATDTCGAAVDLVREGESGVLVHDEGAMAAALVRLARDRALAMRLGAGARALIEREWTPAIGGERIAALAAMAVSEAP